MADELDEVVGDEVEDDEDAEDTGEEPEGDVPDENTNPTAAPSKREEEDGM